MWIPPTIRIRVPRLEFVEMAHDIPRNSEENVWVSLSSDAAHTRSLVWKLRVMNLRQMDGG